MASTILGTIADYVCHVAKIISKTADTDVIIADNNFDVVGITDRYFVRHSRVLVNSMLGQVIVNQKEMVIPNKNEYPICRQCKDFEECQITGFIGVPIFFEDRVIGGIALLFPRHRVENVIKDKEKIIKFIKVMIENLLEMIPRGQRIYELNKTIKEKEQILEILSDAVVLTDDKGTVKYCNKQFQSMVQLNLDLVGEKIQNIIPHKVIYDIFETGQEYENQKVLIELENRTFYGFVSCRIEWANGIKSGVIFGFKTIDDVMQNARAVEKGSMVTLQWLNGWLMPVNVLDKAKSLAVTDKTILIKGESENLNEILARGIYNFSNRNQQGLNIIYCDSIYRECLDHYIFGEFGEIRKADKGTIFIKNIEDLPVYLQRKLLYFLKYGEIRHDNIKSVKSDVRFIISTTEDLIKFADKGLFLEELYYRISENVIEIPPLRNSRNLLRNMITTGIDFYRKKHRKDEAALSKDALDFLCEYNWHEDTSKIEIFLEQIVLCYKGTVTLDDIYVLGLLPDGKNETVMSINEIEKEKISALLKEGYTKTKISNMLGISRATLYRKIKEYGL